MADRAQLQRQWAAWLRDPSQPQPVGVEPRRMAIYRRLVRNNIASFVESGFPVLQEILTQQQWQGLVDSFIKKGALQSPYFTDIGAQFVEFLTVHFSELEEQFNLPAYSAELAQYERMELDALLSDSPLELVPFESNAFHSNSALLLNPSAQLGEFRFPVAHISPANATDIVAQQSNLLVYANTYNEARKAHFVELNPVSTILVKTLQSQPGIGVAELDGYFIELLGHLEPSVVSNGLHETLLDFGARGLLFIQH